ncbi:MAG: manganese efflux pump MntP family protein [Chloroflexota bacterium]
MNFIEIILIALSMAMDAFAVCLSVGATRRAEGPRATFRLSFHFGLFQFLLPIIGWFAGLTVERYLEAYDHWIVFLLLAFVGGRMIASSFNGKEEIEKNDLSRGWNMVLLSVAVSIDALVIGLSLAIVNVKIWFPAVVIGLVTGLMSLLGLRLGNRLGRVIGKRMEMIGGVVLILIGIRTVTTHIFGF